MGRLKKKKKLYKARITKTDEKDSKSAKLV